MFNLLALAILCLAATQQRVAAQPAEETSFQVFYDALAPFGNWIQDDRYGYVWVPAEIGFHPYYTNGYWEMTVYGNTWVSLYPWGWGPFHYGRWTYDPFYGWIWIPGYEWAPAWVCWRYGGGYYGWAPLGPGFTIQINFDNYYCPDSWWVFTPHYYVYGPRHSIHYSRNRSHKRVQGSSVIGRTNIDKKENSLYPAGPSVEDIKNNTGQEITVQTIYDVPSPGLALPEETVIRMYRPTINPSEKHSAHPIQFQQAPRPIHENQPVTTRRKSIPEYRRQEESSSSRGIPPVQVKDPGRVVAPADHEPTQRPSPTEIRPKQQKTIRTQQPRTEPTTRPVRPVRK